MHEIKSSFILPSAAITVPRVKIKHYIKESDHRPEQGDLVYGRVEYVGQPHSSKTKRADVIVYMMVQ